ncbi:unnamed protein product [Acanthoscelides obtectus]|uniref:Osiris 9 n=1 Tax=Acanthoscelides obtectus TaxID=200917 RepID=A0A9P0LTN9_ACAOB|nr:unnamed protein product [Acanthoscelides obtectus]CAK1648147.1 hypothetical protein AOBTE_LOCUS15561 [Acanthoscelides obtectus]
MMEIHSVYVYFVVLAVSLIGMSCEETVIEEEDYIGEYLIYRDAIRFVESCGKKEFSVCLKERILDYVESLPQEINLGGGLWIKQNQGDRNFRQNEIPGKPRTGGEALDKRLLDRISEYVRTHRVEFLMPQGALKELDKAVVEGRKKKGNKGGGGMGMRGMMMMFYLKAAALGAIALKFIGAVAFKALLVGKIALTIALVIALKKLTDQQHHTSTYEVVAPHHYDDASHYDRSFKVDPSYKDSIGGGRS